MSVPNLIPLQLDLSSGNLVAKSISGIGTVTSVGIASTGPYSSALTVGNSSGPIISVGSITQPTGGTVINGTYPNVSLTGTPGSGAIATITVASGLVTSVAITTSGSGYVIGEILSWSGAGIGTGGTVTITSTNSPIVGSGILNLALNVFTSTTAGIVPASGGGTANYLRADGTWFAPIGTGVTSFNTRTGAITLTSSDVITALTFTPYNGSLNPLGFLTSTDAVTSVLPGSGIGVTSGSLINLNSSVTYAVLASSTITNTGNSVLTGNLGLSPGTSVTGFPPGTVSGTQNINNSAASTALSDATNAYTTGQALPGATVLSASSYELGGTVIIPGLYSIGTTASITGTVTLNAGGNANAVWIFQIGSSLTAAVNSVVALTNGAQAQNVYWLVGSSATFAGTSIFNGTIIANTAITDAGSSTIIGHLFSLTAAVTLDDTTVTATPAGSGVTGQLTVSNTGVLSFNTRTGAVTLLSSDVITALGFTPYNATNPSGYISGNQNITISGDISGSGTTSIILTLPNITTAGTYGLVTVNAKGQVTSGSSPTTLAGYGITDGISSQVSTTLNSGVSITLQGGGTITGLATPVNPTDAATKSYVDTAVEGLSWKEAVEAVATSNITLSGLQSIDNYTTLAGDRILVAGQSSNANNGIYIAATGAWTRSSDASTGAQLDGAAVLIEQGSVYANTQWVQTQQVTTIGTSPVIFIQFSGSSSGVSSFNTRTGAITLTSNDVTTALGFTPGQGTVTSASVVTANGVSGSVSNPTTTPAITLTLGAITPSSVAASGTVTGSNLSGTNTGDQTITLTGDVTGSGTGSFAATLAIVNSNVGTFNNVTVNSKGLVTAASNVAYLTSNQNITVTGDVTGSGTTALTLTLGNVNSNVGTFTNASITVNAKGLITAASSGSAGSGTVTSVQLSSSGSTLTITGTNPITSSGIINVDLPAQSSSGSYTNANITVDGYGRVTAASNGSAGSTRTETVVWQYATTGVGGFSGSPVSTTSGIATATGNSNGLTTYTFTGYTNPPTSVTVYGQVITGPSSWSWNITNGWSGSAPTLNNDTGTVGSPGLITTFSSAPVLSLQLNGTVTNASTSTGSIPYLVVEFKF